MVFDVQQRHASLQRDNSALRLYALIDGLIFTERFGQPLAPVGAQCCSLFEGSGDAALAHAGPWLLDTAQMPAEKLADLAQLERDMPALSWLIAAQTVEGLAQLLSLRLDTHLPDGRAALLRFWDPRVLVSLAEVLDDTQRQEFFAHIDEWHMLHKGRRVWIGRQHAEAQ
jgi:hypothetical protein